MNGHKRRSLLLTSFIVAMAALTGCQHGTAPAPILPLSVPADLAAGQGSYSDRVVISWSEEPGAVFYELGVSIFAGGPFAPLGTTTETMFSDPEVTPGVQYWYRLRACAGECGPWSDVLMGFAAAPQGQPWIPQGLSASQGSHQDRIVIGWLGLPEATSYRLFRAEEIQGPYAEIATPIGNTHEDIVAEDNPLAACRSYWYRVAACRSGLCGEPSLAQEGWRGTRLPEDTSVTGLSASDRRFTDRIRLQWQPVPGATTYSVYRDAQDAPIAITDDPFYEDVHHATDNPLEADRLYSYGVIACGEAMCGCTAMSSRAHGRISSLPGTPIDLKVEARADRVTLSWKTGASVIPPTYYVLERATGQGPFSVIAEIAHPLLSYEDTTATGSTTYRYRLSAANSSGLGEPSAPVAISFPSSTGFGPAP